MHFFLGALRVNARSSFKCSYTIQVFCFVLSLSDVVLIMLINVKMPTIVGILTFLSRINLVLIRVEYKKCNLGASLFNFNRVVAVVWLSVYFVSYSCSHGLVDGICIQL